MDGGTKNEEEKLSLRNLKSNLRDALKNSGVLDNVKAQIRKEFIHNLSGKNLKPRNPGVGTHSRIILSLIYNHLKCSSLINSLSVFSAESGVSKAAVFTDNDLLQMMHFGSESAVCRKLNSAKAQINEHPKQLKSLLDVIVEVSASKAFSGTVDSAVQTGDAGPSAREFLDSNIRQIQNIFTIRQETERLTPLRSIEERMIIFQRDVEERYRRELHTQINNIREHEISKMRLEERQHARSQLDLLRKELEDDYQRRLQAQTRREADSIALAAERERNLQQTQYDLRQKMQADLDDIRNREIASSRKVELELQGLRILEARIREAQVLLDSRDHEITRREREIDDLARSKAEKAKLEMKSQLQNELDLLIRERHSLKLERERLEEDRTLVSTEMELTNDLKIKVREANQTIEKKNDEIQNLQHKLERVEAMRREEELELEEIAKTTSVTIGTAKTMTGQMLQLAQRNVEVETRLRVTLETLDQVQEELSRCKEVIRKYDNEHRDERITIKKLEHEKASLQKERDNLKKSLQMEKANINAMEVEIHELKRLTTEQREVMRAVQSGSKPKRSSSRRQSRLQDSHDSDRVVSSRTSLSPSKRPKESPQDIISLLQAAVFGPQAQAGMSLYQPPLPPQQSAGSFEEVAMPQRRPMLTDVDKRLDTVRSLVGADLSRPIPQTTLPPYSTIAQQYAPQLGLGPSGHNPYSQPSMSENISLQPSTQPALATNAMEQPTNNIVPAVMSTSTAAARNRADEEILKLQQEKERMRREAEQREAAIRARVEEDMKSRLREEERRAEEARKQLEMEVAKRRQEEMEREMERMRREQEDKLKQMETQLAQERQKQLESEEKRLAEERTRLQAEAARMAQEQVRQRDAEEERLRRLQQDALAASQSSIKTVEPEPQKLSPRVSVNVEIQPSYKTFAVASDSSRNVPRDSKSELAEEEASQRMAGKAVEEAEEERQRRKKEEDDENERRRKREEQEEEADRIRKEKAAEDEEKTRKVKEEEENKKKKEDAIKAARQKVLDRRKQKQSAPEPAPEPEPEPVKVLSRATKSRFWDDDGSDEEIETQRLDDSNEDSRW